MKILFSAPDIECDGCAQAIKRALGKTPGVSEVQVDVNTKHVSAFLSAPASDKTVLDALDKAGFPAQTVAA